MYDPKPVSNQGANPVEAATNDVRSARFFLLAAAAVTALGVVAWSGWLGNVLGPQLDQGWGALIGSLAGAGIGLGAVAWQTKVGYRNMIAHQDRQALMDRDARKEQAIFDRADQASTRLNEIQTLASAMHGELFAIAVRLVAFRKGLAIFSAFHETAVAQGHGEHITKVIMLPNIKAPVFFANADKIGLLGPALAADLAQIYSELTTDAAPVDMSHRQAIGAHRSAEANATRLHEMTVHVLARIRAFQAGADMPKSLFEFEAELRAAQRGESG